MKKQDFPGGAVDKNPPANAGDLGFDLWFEKIPNAEQQLRLCAPTSSLHYWACALESGSYNKKSHCDEKPKHRNQRKPR